MRSTRDIIIAAKDGLPITEDELRMALLVMAAVDAFTWRELARYAAPPDGFRRTPA